MAAKKIIYLGILITILFAGCRYNNDIKIHGNGELTTEKRNVQTFSEIDSRIAGDIYITQDQEQSLVVEAQENILDILITKVVGDRLVIEYSRDNVEHDGINIYISMENIDKIILSGVSYIEFENDIYTDALDIEITGVCDMVLSSVHTKEVYVSFTGAGEIYVAGPEIAEYMDINITGVGTIDAFEFPVESVEIINTGTGVCKVYAIDKMDVINSGVGNVYYKGNPSKSFSNTGLGSIIHVGD